MKIEIRKKSLFTANAAMERYFDKYDHFNFDRKYVEPHSRKGRSKKEAQQNTNRSNPSGHERTVIRKKPTGHQQKMIRQKPLTRINYME